MVEDIHSINGFWQNKIARRFIITDKLKFSIAKHRNSCQWLEQNWFEKNFIPIVIMIIFMLAILFIFCLNCKYSYFTWIYCKETKDQNTVIKYIFGKYFSFDLPGYVIMILTVTCIGFVIFTFSTKIIE